MLWPAGDNPGGCSGMTRVAMSARGWMPPTPLSPSAGWWGWSRTVRGCFSSLTSLSGHGTRQHSSAPSPLG